MDQWHDIREFSIVFRTPNIILLEYSNIFAPKIILEMSIEFNIKEKIYIILCTFFTVLIIVGNLI
ncbi:hypothetical protein JRD95_00126 [Rickettsia parkeri]|nr:hypothetical protein JRD95_00126 [Rickettsia parkeri]